LILQSAFRLKLGLSPMNSKRPSLCFSVCWMNNNGDRMLMQLKTDCEVVFFVSSYGHCTFDCRYCIIHPIAKEAPFAQLRRSGVSAKRTWRPKGLPDFFGAWRFFGWLWKIVSAVETSAGSSCGDRPGYQRRSRSAFSVEKLVKIRYNNLIMHYHQVKKRGLLETWAGNAIMYRQKESMW
jgi:hypothetical protein